MEVDPSASMAPFTIKVEVAGRVCTIEPEPAATWIALLVSGDYEGILPGLLDDEDAEGLDEALWSGELSANELREAILDVITVVSGRDWWWALNLLAVCRSAWPQMYGTLVRHGFNAHVEPFAAFLDALYSLCVEEMPEDRRRSFDTALDQAPAGYRTINEEGEAHAFLALMNGKSS